METSAKQSAPEDLTISRRNMLGSLFGDNVIILDPKYAGIEGGQGRMLKLHLLSQAEITKTL